MCDEVCEQELLILSGVLLKMCHRRLRGVTPLHPASHAHDLNALRLVQEIKAVVLVGSKAELARAGGPDRLAGK